MNKLQAVYKPADIEARWQARWEEEKTYAPAMDTAKKPFYNLMMFPYPSAEGMHVGNMYAFTGADVYGRFMRMQGYQVLEPIGLDGFGIHSENYALKIGTHPMDQAQTSEKNFYRQLRATGNSYDWSRTVETYNSDYYKWTQWLFAKMFHAGLAYRKKASVNFCPSCKTVLADEQVIDGKCERCGSVVEKKELEQWFFRITKYAERLLANIPSLDWTEKVKIAQSLWIGKKTGITITYKIDGSSETVTVFTTRPDTNFGATFIALAPEHPFVEKITTAEHKNAVDAYSKATTKKSDQDRIASGREKTGVFTGSYAINQLTGYKMPIWVSDFVLMGFGTGAVVGVPGHDVRDFEFATTFGLEIKRVVVGKDNDQSPITTPQQVQEEEGTMINSDFLDGMPVHAALEKIMDYLEEKGYGKRETTYHLRDWLISRQRYWGAPIPMIYCVACGTQGKGEQQEMPGWYSVPEKDLPVRLPHIADYKPLGTGTSPLATYPEFYETTCPSCKGNARRETDVSDTFLDSAWYFFRYTSTELTDEAFSKERVKRWLPVNMYIGGAEHSVLHLLYSRFVTMVMKDLGYISFEEPFTTFFAHGLLIKEGAKMSKSKGNVVIPDAYITKYGADTLRCYLMFLGPFNQGGDFYDTGIEGMHRFLKRVWHLFSGELGDTHADAGKHSMHKTIRRVREDLSRLHYNTAIAGLMEWYNELSKKPVSKEEATVFLQLLAPFAPHMTEELWYLRLGNTTSIHVSAFPTHDERYLRQDEVTVVVQVNGKVRDTLRLSTTDAMNKTVLEQKARKSQKVAAQLAGAGKIVRNVITIPGKIINFVVS